MNVAPCTLPYLEISFFQIICVLVLTVLISGMDFLVVWIVISFILLKLLGCFIFKNILLMNKAFVFKVFFKQLLVLKKVKWYALDIVASNHRSSISFITFSQQGCLQKCILNKNMSMITTQSYLYSPSIFRATWLYVLAIEYLYQTVCHILVLIWNKIISTPTRFPNVNALKLDVFIEASVYFLKIGTVAGIFVKYIILQVFRILISYSPSFDMFSISSISYHWVSCFE